MAFKIKHGIYFTPDPAFKGKPRELVAEDYVYSWKRLIDPKTRSLWSFILDGKLMGADEVVAAAITALSSKPINRGANHHRDACLLVLRHSLDPRRTQNALRG